ncbi:peptide ABC transporter permease [Bacillus clarus]|uniref:Binding--dependent transport system inner membrane component family protein n=1 Tax=Bacillus clarus TaxID=2338372 RepID=A0A090YSM8_9BACI|nr:binding--dependent transport system inner membrane component family protein [Bacillus clarus]RFT61718.1 peptide ABC transporter permease [Bacillus clarus]
MEYRYNEKGEIAEVAPFSISRTHWFGTDREGEDLFYKVIDGAKYTILISFFVAVARVIISLLMSLLIRNDKWGFSLLQRVTVGLQFFPQTLFCILFLTPFIIYELRTKPIVTNIEVLCIQGIVLVFVAVPRMTRFFQKEVQQIWRQEYMISSLVLGGSRWHIFRTHIMKVLQPQMIFQIGEQMVQVLLIMLHLAIFKLFLGGTNIVSGQAHDQFSIYFPYLNDWASLISYYYGELMLEPRIIMIPVIFYMILLYCMTKVVNQYKHHI